jgi:iron-sulfur cluster assembly accessory protein
MEQQITLQGAAGPALDGPLHITLTSQAAAKARALMARDPRPGVALRVGVEGGGCSGMQYTLTFDERRADDVSVEQDGVTVLVDAKSAGYLDGLTLDYVDALSGAGFKFLNPNASRTCGCGSSFSA